MWFSGAVLEQLEATVVVATRNRSGLLPRLVAALEAQESAPPFEVVLVDDASDDHTPGVLSRLAATATIPMRAERLRQRAGQSAARNRGWRSSSASLVLFCDDDCVPSSKWVGTMVVALGQFDLVQGRTRSAPDQECNRGPFSRTIDVDEADGFYATCNMGYRRSWLERVGGFDERYGAMAGEDTDLALRCVEEGATTSFVPAAVVDHDISSSSFLAALRGTRRWRTLPITLARHPRLGAAYYSRWFWRETHVPTVATMTCQLVGGVVAVTGRRRMGFALMLAGFLPWANHRLRKDAIAAHKPTRLALLPAAYAVDVAEVVALVQGSIEARRLLL